MARPIAPIMYICVMNDPECPADEEPYRHVSVYHGCMDYGNGFHLGNWSPEGEYLYDDTGDGRMPIGKWKECPGCGDRLVEEEWGAIEREIRIETRYWSRYKGLKVAEDMGGWKV